MTDAHIIALFGHGQRMGMESMMAMTVATMKPNGDIEIGYKFFARKHGEAEFKIQAASIETLVHKMSQVTSESSNKIIKASDPR